MEKNKVRMTFSLTPECSRHLDEMIEHFERTTNFKTNRSVIVEKCIEDIYKQIVEEIRSE